MKREQLQSWNILSFNPKTMDVDEHIDLINTLGDMVDQKEEAKKEKFIETMPTMIQTHLITCKDWDTVKDTAKSLEHIIMKCDPPTPAMPMMATGATVPGLYSHIAHSVDKEEGDIPQPFKGTKPKQTRGRGKPKGKPQDQRQNPPKSKRWKRMTIMKALTIITTIPQVRVEAADLIMVRAETDNLEDLYHEIEDKDLNIVNIIFRITAIREAYRNKIVHNMVAHVSRISKGTNSMHIEAGARVGVLSISEDAPTAGRISRITLALININTTHMTSNQNSMAHHVVCVEDLTIPPSIVTKGNMILITLWKR